MSTPQPDEEKALPTTTMQTTAEDAVDEEEGLAIPPPATLSDHCTNDPPLDPSATSSGEIVKLADTEVYISKPSDVETGGSSLLILLTNGVGVHSINNQIQADHFARKGYFVVMPDLFKGDPAPNAATVTAQEENVNLLEQIKMKAAEGVKGFLIDMWLARHTPENTMPVIDSVLAAVKEQYADKQYTESLGVYAVGYCFGGKYALRLAAGDGITAAAVAHGTMVTIEDIQAVKKPVTFACVENDGLFPDEVREAGRKHLEEAKIEHEIKVYKGVPHGFGVYGSYPDSNIKSSQKDCFEQFVNFLGTN